MGTNITRRGVAEQVRQRHNITGQNITSRGLNRSDRGTTSPSWRGGCCRWSAGCAPPHSPAQRIGYVWQMMLCGRVMCAEHHLLQDVLNALDGFLDGGEFLVEDVAEDAGDDALDVCAALGSHNV